MFLSNNRASFHLRRKKSLVKHQKVSKYLQLIVDVEFEHLQRRYQNLLDQSPNQPE